MVLDKEDGRWLVAGGGSPAASPGQGTSGGPARDWGGREALPALLAPVPVPILILILILSLPSEAARCWAVGRALGVSADAF